LADNHSSRYGEILASASGIRACRYAVDHRRSWRLHSVDFEGARQMTPAIEWLGHRPKLTTALIIAAVYGAFLFERM